MSEFNLSELIYVPSKLRSGMDCKVIQIDNVREFIKLLKGNFAFAAVYHGTEIHEIIDKLAGDKLNGEHK